MRRAHGVLLVVVAAACVAAVVGAVRLWPAAPPQVDAGSDPNVTLRDGTLTAIEQVGTADDPGLAPGSQALRVTARLADGRTVTFEMVDETGDTFAVGQEVRVAEAAGPDGGLTYYINDIRRGRPLAILAAIFLVSVVVFGRWQGVRALLGLALTLGVVVLFLVPAVLAGAEPVAVALCAAVAIMVVTLYLTHGVRPKTTAAVLGTLLALTITVGLSWLFIELSSLTGLADEDARMASLSVGGLSLRGLLLAGIIVGALGVLDDVTMAQASTVFELRRADPRASAGALFSGAMTVGRDHVGATINTLFLAYAGASLPLLILFSGSPDPLPVIASSEVVAVEVVRTLVGSIGLMASVPLTTALAAWLAGGTADEEVEATAPPRSSRRDRRRGRRRERVGEPGDGSTFVDVADDDLEWERRLRESYGLHRRPHVPDEGDR